VFFLLKPRNFIQNIFSKIKVNENLGYEMMVYDENKRGADVPSHYTRLRRRSPRLLTAHARLSMSSSWKRYMNTSQFTILSHFVVEDGRLKYLVNMCSLKMYPSEIDNLASAKSTGIDTAIGIDYLGCRTRSALSTYDCNWVENPKGRYIACEDSSISRKSRECTWHATRTPRNACTCMRVCAWMTVSQWLILRHIKSIRAK